MKDVLTRIQACRMCEGEAFQLIHSLAPSPVADSYLKNPEGDPSQALYPMDLYLCVFCGHVQMLDVISPEVIFADYRYVSGRSSGTVDHFRQYRDWMLAHYTFAKGDLFVDVGSNDGTLVKQFQDAGFRAVGIEPAAAIAKVANEQGVETVCAAMSPAVSSEIAAKYGRAKLVTMNNVIDSLDRLRETVAAAAQLLAEDGLIAFENFYFPASVRNLIFDFQYHEHLNYLTLTPFATMLARMGLEVIRVEEIDAKGGSIRCVVQRLGGSHPVDPSVSAILAAEKQMGVNEAGDLYPEFRRRIDAQKSPAMAYLRGLKAQGRSIAGFGASATSTTLVYHYGMQDLLDFVVDENPAKQGTFLPGTRIPVYAPARLLEHKPDAVVVLAWRYFAPIQAKNLDYLKRGGQFVLPLPEFKIIQDRNLK